MTYQQAIIKDYELNGWDVIKTIRLNKSGYPDLICLKDGCVKFIEVKEGDDTLRPLQKFRIDSLIKNGFDAFAVHNKKGIIYPEKLKKN